MRLPCHRITTNQKALVIFYRPCLTWLPPLLNDDLLKAELKIRWRTSVFCFVFFPLVPFFFFFSSYIFLSSHFIFCMKLLLFNVLSRDLVPLFSLDVSLCKNNKKKDPTDVLLYYWRLGFLWKYFSLFLVICAFHLLIQHLLVFCNFLKFAASWEKKMKHLNYFLKVSYFLFFLYEKKNQQ